MKSPFCIPKWKDNTPCRLYFSFQQLNPSSAKTRLEKFPRILSILWTSNFKFATSVSSECILPWTKQNILIIFSVGLSQSEQLTHVLALQRHNVTFVTFWAKSKQYSPKLKDFFPSFQLFFSKYLLASRGPTCLHKDDTSSHINGLHAFAQIRQFVKNMD